MKRFIIISILLFFSIVSIGQSRELLPYKWKYRVLVMMSERHDDPMVKKQMETLKSRKPDLKVRKMLLISATPSTMQVLYPEQSKVQESDIYSELKLWDDPFEIVLLGLDGRDKERNIKPIEAQKLFDFIDTMPMRKAEMSDY